MVKDLGIMSQLHVQHTSLIKFCSNFKKNITDDYFHCELIFIIDCCIIRIIYFEIINVEYMYLIFWILLKNQIFECIAWYNANYFDHYEYLWTSMSICIMVIYVINA